MHNFTYIFFISFLICLNQVISKPKMPQMTPEEDPTLRSEILAEEQMKVCLKDIYCKDIHDQMAEIRSKECLGTENQCYKYQLKFARLLNRLCYFFNKEIENVDEMCADGVSQHIIYAPAKCETCAQNKDQTLKNEFHNPNKEFFIMVFENKLLSPKQMALCMINQECDKIEEKIEGLVENICSGTFEQCIESYKQILYEECQISKILLGHEKECVNMNKYYSFDHDVCSACPQIKSKAKSQESSTKEAEKVEL